MPGLHAKLAPSASKRWLSCTASPLYIQALIQAGKIKGDGETVYSREGTEAHDWAAKLLNGNIQATDIPKDFRPHIQEYARVCAECEEGMGDASLRLVETKVPLFYSLDEEGTVDYSLMRMDKKGRAEELFVRDLKYGAGVPVDAEENTQLAIYAHSLILDLKSWWGSIPGHTPVSIGIHQPRYQGDDPLKLWEITVDELAEFCADITRVAKGISRARSIDELQFSPSPEVCQFCPAKDLCQPRFDFAFTELASINGLDLMKDLDLPEVETVPLETRVAIWKHRKDIVKWLDSAEESLTAMAVAGNPAPGTKLVQGRAGNRAWKDTEASEKFLVRHLKDDAYKPQEILSPAKAEAALKSVMDKKTIEAHMQKLTERPEGKEVLTVEEDSRPAVRAAVDHFSVLTDEDEQA